MACIVIAWIIGPKVLSKFSQQCEQIPFFASAAGHHQPYYPARLVELRREYYVQRNFLWRDFDIGVAHNFIEKGPRRVAGPIIDPSCAQRQQEWSRDPKKFGNISYSSAFLSLQLPCPGVDFFIRQPNEDAMQLQYRISENTVRNLLKTFLKWPGNQVTGAARTS